MRGRPEKIDKRKHIHSFKLNDVEEGIFTEMREGKSISNFLIDLMAQVNSGGHARRVVLNKKRDALRGKEQHIKTQLLQTENERILIEGQIETMKITDEQINERRLKLLEKYVDFERTYMTDAFDEGEKEEIKERFRVNKIPHPIELGFDTIEEAWKWLVDQREKQSR